MKSSCDKEKIENGQGGTYISLLDSKKRNSNRKRSGTRFYCGYYAVLGKNKEGDGHVMKVFCKKYGCPTCGRMKANSIRKKIENAIIEFQLNTFLTLTIDPRSCTPENSPKYIQLVWNRFLTKIRKEYKSVTYIRVIEFQKKTKNAHLHVLLNLFIPFEWIDNKWREAGGGIVRIERAREPARYVCKYLTKELKTEIYGRFRRVSSSRNIRLTLPRQSSGYEISKKSYKFHYIENINNLKKVNSYGNIETGFTYHVNGVKNE